MSERPEFEQRFITVVEHMGPGRLSLRQAAQELGIGFATLQAREQTPDQISVGTQ